MAENQTETKEPAPAKGIDIDLLKKRFETSQTKARKRFGDFQRWENWYDGILPKEFRIYFSGEYKDRSALVPPLVGTCIRDLRSKIINALFSTKPFFQLEGNYDPQILDMNQRLVDFQFAQEDDLYREKLAEQVMDWLIYGIGIKSAHWRVKYDELTDEYLYEGFGFDIVDPYKFYPAPYTDTEGNLPYYFIQSVFIYEQLQDRAEHGLLDREAVEGIELKDIANFKQDIDNYEIDTGASKLDLTKEADRRICPVLIWSYTDKNEKIFIANKKHILKRDKNKIKSRELGLSILNLGGKKSDLVGKSAIDVIEDAFIEKFYLRNRRMDESAISLYSQYISDDPDAPAMFRASPGKIHKVGTGRKDNYVPMEFHGKLEPNILEENLVTRELKQALGLEDIFMGISPSRRETATTNLILQQNAASDMSFTIGQIEDKLLSKDVLMCLKVNAQLFPKIQIPPAYKGMDIRGDWIIYQAKVKALGMTQMTSKTVVASTLTGVMEQWKTIPALADVDWHLLAKTQAQAIGLPNADNIIPDSEQKLIPIEKENAMMVLGIFVPVDEREPHLLHLKYHQGVPNSEKHIQQHQIFLEEKIPAKMRENLITSEEKQSRSVMARIEPKTPKQEGVF